MPDPGAYKTTLGMTIKKNMFIYKQKRTSFCDDIIKKAKETPGPDIYEPIYKDKIKGAFNK